MINIKKNGSSILITSDNNQFPWKDGKMSVPFNSIAYIIDESDYVTFRSVANNDILFTSLISELKINDTSVSKDDLIMMFDNVANSSGSGGGTASAGVNSINGFQGDLNIKTVNGTSLIGSGDITIEGGSAEETDPIFTEWKNGMKVELGKATEVTKNLNSGIGINVKVTSGIYNHAIGSGLNVSSKQSSIVMGGNSTVGGDGNIVSIGNTNNVSGSHNYVIGNNITIEDENTNNIAIGNTVKANGEYNIAIGAATIYDEGTEDEEIYPTEANGEGSIAIGNETIANNSSLAIGSSNNINNASAAFGLGNTITSENSLVIGNNNSLNDGSFKFAYGFFNEPKNDQEINIGTLCKSRTGNTDAERTHFVISSYNNSNGEDNTSCFEIRNDDSIYIKKDNELVKLQDMLNKVWYGTQSQYDAISKKDENTTYYILED